MDKLYIVMPAYNESANIESVVDQWHPVAGSAEDTGTEIPDENHLCYFYALLHAEVCPGYYSQTA